MTTVTVEEAQARLPELLDRVAASEELVVTRQGQPVARLSPEQEPRRKPREAGNCRGMLTIVADDDEHLRDFAEHMNP